MYWQTALAIYQPTKCLYLLREGMHDEDEISMNYFRDEEQAQNYSSDVKKA